MSTCLCHDCDIAKLSAYTVIGYRSEYDVIIVNITICAVPISKYEVRPVLCIFLKQLHFKALIVEQFFVKIIFNDDRTTTSSAPLVPWQAPQLAAVYQINRTLVQSLCWASTSSGLLLSKSIFRPMKQLHDNCPPFLLHSPAMSSTILSKDWVWTYP